MPRAPAVVRAVACVLAVLASGTAFADGEPTLIDAVKAGDRPAALRLLQEKADATLREADGTTALHYAAHAGDAELVERLLRAGAAPDPRNDYGSTPLLEAAEIGSAPVIKLLLKAGVKPDSANPENQTALMAVARTGNVEAAKLLLRAGAKVDARESWGEQTALMWAASQSHPDMITLLLKAGADPDARGAVRDWQRRITAEPRPKGMNRGGFTPLLYAAREGCVDCAKRLLDGKADINRADPERTSPLVLALLNMRFDLAAYLVSAGADVDKWDFYGQTPLYVAIDMNTLPIGGRPDLPSEDHTSALQVADMLLKHGANPNIQLKLRPPYRNYIFDRGGDNILSIGATPLLRAAKAGDVPAIELLLRYKANVNLPNAQGVTPLMAAAGMGHGANPTRGRFKTDADAAASLEVLAKAGGQLDAQAQDGTTALHAAAAHGWNETVKLLVASGARLEPLDRAGLTPYDHAAGRYTRAFLSTEVKPFAPTMELLKGYIVAATGRQPRETVMAPPPRTRGTGGNQVPASGAAP